MGKPTFRELLSEDAQAAYKRMRREVAEDLTEADDTVHRASIAVINLPEGRTAEESALSHEIGCALKSLRHAWCNLLGMSSIRQGGLERRSRIGNGSIEVSTKVSDEVNEPQRQRALVLLLDAHAEHRPLHDTWSIVRPPYDQQLGSVAATVMESLAHDGLVQYQAPFNFVLTDAGRAAAEDALVEKVHDELEAKSA